MHLDLMRKNLIWLAVTVVAALLQTTWLDAIRVQGVLPDLTLLLVIYFAVTDGEERAMFTGLLGGLYQDVASDTALGHHVLCLVIVGYAAGRMARRLIADHPAVKVGLVFAASIVHGLLYLTIQYVHDPENTQAFYTFGTTTLPGAFYTALCTPFFYVLSRMFHRTQESFDGEPS
jgi:rod shape-determining protein MreD